MAQNARIIGKTTVGMAFVLDENCVAGIVRDNADGAHYRDEEDRNAFFLFATGNMAKLGHQTLREPRPFDAEANDVSKDPLRAGIWSFGSEEALRAAFACVTYNKTFGTAFMLEVKRVAKSAAA